MGPKKSNSGKKESKPKEEDKSGKEKKGGTAVKVTTIRYWRYHRKRTSYHQLHNNCYDFVIIIDLTAQDIAQLHSNKSILSSEFEL